MTALLRLEARTLFGALRRIVTQPSRRALWFVTGALAAVAIAFDVATSGVASRELGAWSPSPLLVIAVAAAMLAFAAFVGSRTPLTYGTRAADAVWWHYAGFDRSAGQRATTAILTARATLTIALGAVPIAALFALAAPQRAGTIVALALVVIALAPATVLVSSAFAPHAAPNAVATPRFGVGDASAPEPDAAPAVRPSVPRGLMAARWLVAARRDELLVPYDRFALGIAAGLVVPRVSALAGGQVVALAVIIGPLAVLLDASIRSTTAPATLRSPWWRAAVGTSALALAAWAFCDGAGISSLLAGVALGLGIALGNPLPALAAVPAILVVPTALRLVVLAVDTFYPSDADRRGAGAAARLFVVWQLALATGAFALAAASRGGAYAAIGATTATVLAVAAVAAWCCAVRLPAAVA